MTYQTHLSNADIVRIVQGYYDAVDSLDAARLADTYMPGPTTTLQFNADEPIVTAEAIRAFTEQFSKVLAAIRHTMSRSGRPCSWAMSCR